MGKNYKKKGKRNYLKQTYSSPVPNKTYAKLRYAEQETLSLSAQIQKSHIFSANGMWDPNYSGVGHQPRGFDEWMAMYDHFTVLGSKITCTYINRGTTSEPVNVGLALTDDNIGVTSFNDLFELGKVQTRTLSHPEGGKGTATLSKGFSAKKFFSRADVMDNEELRGSALANPVEGAWYQVLVNTAVPSTLDVDIVLYIDYIVCFSEPKQPVQS